MKFIILALIGLAVIGIASADQQKSDDERLRETIAKAKGVEEQKTIDMSEGLIKLKEFPNKIKEIAKRVQDGQKAKMDLLKAKLNEGMKMIQNKANEKVIGSDLALMEFKNEKLSRFLEAIKQAQIKNEKQN